MILKTLGTLASAEGKLLGWSDEFKKFYSSGYRCPQCNERLLDSLGTLTIKFYSSKKEIIPMWKLAIFRAEFAECPKCNFLWKIKGENEFGVPETFNILSIIETNREEESIGTDKRIIDNSMSSVRLRRKFVVSKQWTKTCSIEHEKAQSENSGLTIGINETSIKTSCEETLKKKFSISEEIQETYSEEVEVDVPGSTKLTILLNWKRIWQCGFLKCSTESGENLRIPFRVIVGITFDQLQFDEGSQNSGG